MARIALSVKRVDVYRHHSFVILLNIVHLALMKSIAVRYKLIIIIAD